MINVIAELQHSLTIYPHSPVENMDIDRFGKHHDLSFPFLDFRQYLLLYPCFLVSQEIGCQFNRLFHAYAPVTEIPAGPPKEVTRRRIVEVYFALVRKNELYPS